MFFWYVYNLLKTFQAQIAECCIQLKSIYIVTKKAQGCSRKMFR